MAQSQDRKTEEPTDRRLRDARDDGQIARSQDVSTAIVLSAVALAIWFSRDWIGARLQTLARLALDYPAQLTRNLVDDDPLSAALRVGLAVQNVHNGGAPPALAAGEEVGFADYADGFAMPVDNDHARLDVLLHVPQDLRQRRS